MDRVKSLFSEIKLNENQRSIGYFSNGYFSIYYIKSINLVFAETKSVTKSRVHGKLQFSEKATKICAICLRGHSKTTSTQRGREGVPPHSRFTT